MIVSEEVIRRACARTQVWALKKTPLDVWLERAFQISVVLLVLFGPGLLQKCASLLPRRPAPPPPEQWNESEFTIYIGNPTDRPKTVRLRVREPARAREPLDSRQDTHA